MLKKILILLTTFKSFGGWEAGSGLKALKDQDEQVQLEKKVEKERSLKALFFVIQNSHFSDSFSLRSVSKDLLIKFSRVNSFLDVSKHWAYMFGFFNKEPTSFSNNFEICYEPSYPYLIMCSMPSYPCLISKTVPRPISLHPAYGLFNPLELALDYLGDLRKNDSDLLKKSVSLRLLQLHCSMNFIGKVLIPKKLENQEHFLNEVWKISPVRNLSLDSVEDVPVQFFDESGRELLNKVIFQVFKYSFSPVLGSKITLKHCSNFDFDFSKNQIDVELVFKVVVSGVDITLSVPYLDDFNDFDENFEVEPSGNNLFYLAPCFWPVNITLDYRNNCHPSCSNFLELLFNKFVFFDELLFSISDCDIFAMTNPRVANAWFLNVDCKEVYIPYVSKAIGLFNYRMVSAVYAPSLLVACDGIELVSNSRESPNNVLSVQLPEKLVLNRRAILNYLRSEYSKCAFFKMDDSCSIDFSPSDFLYY